MASFSRSLSSNEIEVLWLIVYRSVYGYEVNVARCSPAVERILTQALTLVNWPEFEVFEDYQ